jgi:hypothetical protein
MPQNMPSLCRRARDVAAISRLFFSMQKGFMLMKRNLLSAIVLAALLSLAAVASADQKLQPVSSTKSAVQTVAFVKNADCPPAAAPVCSVYQPCVIYKHCGRCCCDCSPPVKQVLLVKDPCDCCCVAEIPVCLPACCKEACVSSKCGLRGRRGVVTYEYDCGVCVTFTFRRCGDVVVTYRGC